jgi:hypothetical protein
MDIKSDEKQRSSAYQAFLMLLDLEVARMTGRNSRMRVTAQGSTLLGGREAAICSRYCRICTIGRDPSPGCQTIQRHLPSTVGFGKDRVMGVMPL